MSKHNDATSDQEIPGAFELEDTSRKPVSLGYGDRICLGVGAALIILQETLRVSKLTIQQQDAVTKASTTTDPSIKSLRQLLDSRDRRKVEQAVDRFTDEMPSRILDAYQQVPEMRAVLDAQSDEIYPPSPEQVAAGGALILSRVERELVDEFFKGLDEQPLQLAYANALLRTKSTEAPSAFIGRALLPLLISGFEDFLGALIRTALYKYPQGLGELPNIPFEITERYKNNAGTDDFKRWAIDKKVSDFLDGGPQDWARRIQQWARIDVNDFGNTWDVLTEAIQRRHTAVHNSGRADANYMSKVPPVLRPHAIMGMPLDFDEDYMLPLIARLETFSNCISYRWIKKFADAPPASFHLAATRAAIVRLENMGEWASALAICNVVLDCYQTPDEGRGIFQINQWYCKQQIGLLEPSMAAEISNWVPPDVMSQLGQAALLHDHGELVRLLQTEVPAKTRIGILHQLRHYPLLKREVEASQPIRLALQGKANTAQSAKRVPKARRKHR